ncbi:unnamed protein product [Effrenium voratum]|nr:unnamed protein product [Effrenium voratum]
MKMRLALARLALLPLALGLLVREKRNECKIFAMWDYHPNKVPFFIQKDIESWMKHSHGRCGSPVLLNDTNIKEYIPDLPAEYFRLPDHGARSDVIRYALIYHHGGIYMDTDILIAKDLTEVLDKVTTGQYDLLSYAGRKDCQKFSSNFLAGRKHSSFMKEVWEAQKKKLTNHCDSHGKETQACCPDDPNQRCQVHWGGLGEMVSHPVFEELIRSKKSLKTYCYAEQDGQSFVPEGLGTVLFTKRKLSDALPYFKSIKTKNPVDRLAYHLFNAQGFEREYDGSAIFDASLYVGALFRKSLGNISLTHMPADDGPATYCGSEGEMCRCAGRVYFGRKFDNDKDGDRLTLSQMTLAQHRTMMASGHIACSISDFGGDPQINRPKQCLCQAMQGVQMKSPANDGPATICANEGEMCHCHGKAYYGRKFEQKVLAQKRERFEETAALSLAETVQSVYRMKTAPALDALQCLLCLTEVGLRLFSQYRPAATYGQKLKATSRTLASVSTASPMSTPRSSLTPRCLRRTDSLELPLLSPQRPRPPPPPKADPWRDLVFKTSFQTADKDGDGRLSFAEFSLMLRRSDPTLNRAQIEEAWAAADLDGDRFVSPEEFVHWAKPLDALDDEGEDDAVEPSAALFRLWDLDENGAISPEELEFVMSKVRPRLSEQELAELFAVMDADRDGAVSYAEFVEFLFES